MPRVTACYAALLALLFLVLSFRVIRQRYRARVAVGTGGDPRLERAVRVHANFAEYVPFVLLLVLLAELLGTPAWWLHTLGAALVIGRVFHAYGVSRTPETLVFRQIGMVLTFSTLAAAALTTASRAL